MPFFFFFLWKKAYMSIDANHISNVYVFCALHATNTRIHYINLGHMMEDDGHHCLAG